VPDVQPQDEDRLRAAANSALERTGRRPARR